MPEWSKFISHKTVHAAPIFDIVDAVPMPEWSKFISHWRDSLGNRVAGKTVHAAPIFDIVDADGKLTILVKPYGDHTVVAFHPTEPGMVNRCSPGDYAMIYRDGYCSVCPKKEFEDGYSALPDGP